MTNIHVLVIYHKTGTLLNLMRISKCFSKNQNFALNVIVIFVGKAEITDKFDKT